MLHSSLAFKNFGLELLSKVEKKSQLAEKALVVIFSAKLLIAPYMNYTNASRKIYLIIGKIPKYSSNVKPRAFISFEIPAPT
jgi:hypothetical protein